MSEERPPKQRHTHPPRLLLSRCSPPLDIWFTTYNKIGKSQRRGEEKRAEDGDKKKNVSN